MPYITQRKSLASAKTGPGFMWTEREGWRGVGNSCPGSAHRDCAGVGGGSASNGPDSFGNAIFWNFKGRLRTGTAYLAKQDSYPQSRKSCRYAPHLVIGRILWPRVSVGIPWRWWGNEGLPSGDGIVAMIKPYLGMGICNF